MSPGPTAAAFLPACFPRVSGDEPIHVTALVTNPWFSPRERG